MKNIKLNVSQQRQFEGEVRLQSVGVKQGIKAKNLMIGDDVVFNFGTTYKVVDIAFSKTGKTLNVTFEYINFMGELTQSVRKYNAETLVVVKELNPAPAVEEVEEVVEVEVETEAEAEATEEAETIVIEILHDAHMTEIYHATTNRDEAVSLVGYLLEDTDKEVRMVVVEPHNDVNTWANTIPQYTVKKILPAPTDQDIQTARDNIVKAVKEECQDQPVMEWYEVDVQTYYKSTPATFNTYYYETLEECMEKVDEAIHLYIDYVGLCGSIFTYKVINGVRHLCGIHGISKKSLIREVS